MSRPAAATCLAPLVLVRPNGEATASSRTGMFVISPNDELSLLEADLAKEFHDNRFALSTREEWLPGSHDDYDAYDKDPNTIYIVKTVQNADGNIIFASGIRFTRIGGDRGVGDSLTWSMMDGNPDMQSAILSKDDSRAVDALNAASDEDRLWDMTRLVPRMDGALSLKDIVPTMRELFGKGLDLTAIQTGKEPLWFFLIDSRSLGFLMMSGIEAEIIHSQKVSERDRDVSHFCVINPVAAYKKLQELACTKPADYNASFEDVTRGFLS